MPSEHAMQCGCPSACCTCPMEQVWHDVEPLLGATVPARQAVHDVLLLAPTAVPILPGAQPVHAIFFFSSW